MPEFLNFVVVTLAGLLLLGFFIALGYQFRFWAGTLIGSALLIVAVFVAVSQIQDGMGKGFLVVSLFVVGPLVLAAMALQAHAGQLIREKKHDQARNLIRVPALLWIAFMVVSAVLNWTGF